MLLAATVPVLVVARDDGRRDVDSRRDTCSEYLVCELFRSTLSDQTHDIVAHISKSPGLVGFRTT